MRCIGGGGGGWAAVAGGGRAANLCHAARELLQAPASGAVPSSCASRLGKMPALCCSGRRRRRRRAARMLCRRAVTGPCGPVRAPSAST